MRRFAASLGSLVKDRRGDGRHGHRRADPAAADRSHRRRAGRRSSRPRVRVGEVLLASGTSAIDTATQVKFIAATYGLAQCDVDVTYNSIVVSAHRGPLIPPASTMRIVHYRSMDFTRLAARRPAHPPDPARGDHSGAGARRARRDRLRAAPLQPVDRHPRLGRPGGCGRGAARRWAADHRGLVLHHRRDRPRQSGAQPLRVAVLLPADDGRPDRGRAGRQRSTWSRTNWV